MTKLRNGIALLLLAIGAGSAAMFGEQVFGSGSATFAILVTSCHLNGHLRPLTPVAISVITGASGSILFRCEENEAAFNVTNTGLATPFFSLPTGYSELTIITHVPNAKACTGGARIISGIAYSFRIRGGFDYCALYSNAPSAGLTSFDLTWTRQVPT